MAEQQNRGRPATFPTDHVISLAMDAYWRGGADRPSLNEICRRAGVSKPGLYRVFGGEDRLMEAALDRYAETVLAANFAGVDPSAPLHDTLRALVTGWTDPQRPGPPGCLLAELQHADGLGPSVTKRIATLRQQARSAYGELIDGAKARGEVRGDVATDVAAAMIDIECNAVLVRMAAGEDPELLRAQALLAFSVLA